MYLEKEETKIMIIPDKIINLYCGTRKLEKNRGKDM
jgi:hypothetical protein